MKARTHTTARKPIGNGYQNLLRVMRQNIKVILIIGFLRWDCVELPVSVVEIVSSMWSSVKWLDGQETQISSESLFQWEG